MTTDTRPDIPLGYTRDAQGREIAYKNSDGCWREYTRDTHGYVLTYKTSGGYWYEYTRDTHGRVLTHKSSSGAWYEYTHDAQGKVLAYKDSARYWYEYTRDADGRELTYKDKTGLWTILASDLHYTLRHNAITGIYWAGCRRFTAEQALDHWSVRDDKRAMQFTAAIINQLGQTE